MYTVKTTISKEIDRNEFINIYLELKRIIHNKIKINLNDLDEILEYIKLDKILCGKSPNIKTILLYYNDKIIGFALLKLYLNRKNNKAYIDSLYVKKQYRVITDGVKKELSAAILKNAMEEVFVENNIKIVKLLVPKNFLSNIRLYTIEGYALCFPGFTFGNYLRMRRELNKTRNQR